MNHHIKSLYYHYSSLPTQTMLDPMESQCGSPDSYSMALMHPLGDIHWRVHWCVTGDNIGEPDISEDMGEATVVGGIKWTFLRSICKSMEE